MPTPTGWTWRESVEAGVWRHVGAVWVDIPATLGYESVWTNAGNDRDAMHICAQWSVASADVVPGGLKTGISVIPVPYWNAASLASNAATVGEISGYALGGGFEMALMMDISVIARDTRIGMPATRFLGPALGSLHMFFHRLGPVLARRMLLTGDIVTAADVEHLGVFTETCGPEAVSARAAYWARKAAKMPADGVVIAKEAFRLVEQSQAYQGEEVCSYLFHAYGTNLQFAPGEFNFVKTRAQVGTKEAFRLRDEHFHVPEPEIG